MKIILSALIGGALGFVLVALTGILTLQHDGRQGGVVFDIFSREVPGITNPQAPILPIIGIAALGALVLCALVLPEEGSERTARSMGFLLVTAATVGWGLALGPNLGIYHDMTAGDGVPPGVPGWLRYGSTEPSVYLVAFLALGVLVLRWSNIRAKRSAEESRSA